MLAMSWVLDGAQAPREIVLASHWSYDPFGLACWVIAVCAVVMWWGAAGAVELIWDTAVRWGRR